MKKFLVGIAAAFGLAGCASESAEPEHVVALYEEAFQLYLDDRFEDALPVFEQAASAGSSDAECSLGIIYELGQGVDADHQRAHGWFKKSAEHGSVGGLYRYGRCLHKGIGTEVDLQEALKWYRRALEKDNRLAAFAVAEVEAELNE